MGSKSRTAPGRVPGTSLLSRAAPSLADEEDVSGGLGTVQVGTPESLICEAPDVMEAIAHRVGGAFGGAFPGGRLITFKVSPRAKKKGEQVRGEKDTSMTYRTSSKEMGNQRGSVGRGNRRESMGPHVVGPYMFRGARGPKVSGE